MVRHRAGQAGIAQSVEHFTRNEGVVGSSPISGLLRKHRSLEKRLWCFFSAGKSSAFRLIMGTKGLYTKK